MGAFLECMDVIVLPYILLWGTHHKDTFIYLMIYHWKEVGQNVELSWDKRTNIIYNNSA